MDLNRLVGRTSFVAGIITTRSQELFFIKTKLLQQQVFVETLPFDAQAKEQDCAETICLFMEEASKNKLYIFQ